jgi:hypothetical protein
MTATEAADDTTADDANAVDAVVPALEYNSEENWIFNYYDWSGQIQDAEKRKQFRESFDKYILENPTWCSNIFSGVPEKRQKAAAHFVTRLANLRRGIIEDQSKGINDPELTALVNEMIGKVAILAKKQQQEQKQQQTSSAG